MAAYSAHILGASRIYVVDRVPERLAAAGKIPQCTPIDFSKSDAVDQIIEANGGMVDRAVDCVGYQAVDQGGKKEQPNIVLENLIRVTRACGGLGIPGLYVPKDPGAADEQSGKGQILISFGKLFEKVCRGTLFQARHQAQKVPCLNYLVIHNRCTNVLSRPVAQAQFPHRSLNLSSQLTTPLFLPRVST